MVKIIEINRFNGMTSMLQHFHPILDVFSDLRIQGWVFKTLWEVGQAILAVGVELCCIVRHRCITAGAVEFILPRNHGKHDREIFYVLGKNAYLVKGRGISQQSVTGDPSIARFHANKTTKIGWLPYRTTCVRA